MQTAKIFKQTIAVIICICLVGILGCDKFPFLAKYFPSLKNQEPKEKPKVTQPKSVAKAVKPAMGPNTLARVGDWTIDIDEFEERLRTLKDVLPEYDISGIEGKKAILEELIRQELLVKDAENTGIANEKNIREAVEEFRRTLLVQEIATRVTDDVTVTDIEAREFYEQNKEALSDPPQVRISEIVVTSQVEANDILIELLKGSDFAEMARTRSKGESASKGGDLGFIEQFKFPQMMNAVASLELGGISSVFKGPDGYYIVKLKDKKESTTRDFSEIREDIKAGLLLMRQQQAVLEHISNLKQNASIEINESLLKE